MCKEVVKDVLKEMPNVVEKLEHNQELAGKEIRGLETDGLEQKGTDEISVSDDDR